MVDGREIYSWLYPLVCQNNRKAPDSILTTRVGGKMGGGTENSINAYPR
ncbi:MAG: hypothetical protein SCH39_04090 [Methanosarcinales archaeon]|nr:hypothetical protein [Methanosarcinales archaeon]